MSVPDHRDVVRRLAASGVFALATHEGQAAFTDACVSALHGIDENFGHLRKKPGQTQIHGHGEDAALYKFSDGTAKAVDFIGGAGGLNPTAGWIVDEVTPYKHSDWADPNDHGLLVPASAPVIRIPSYGELGDDHFFRQAIGVPLFADYRTADTQGHPDAKPNDGMSVWFSRPTYELVVEGILAGRPVDPASVVTKYRNQCRALLKLPPV